MLYFRIVAKQRRWLVKLRDRLLLLYFVGQSGSAVFHRGHSRFDNADEVGLRKTHVTLTDEVV